jgi:hypothetical protein
VPQSAHPTGRVAMPVGGNPYLARVKPIQRENAIARVERSVAATAEGFPDPATRGFPPCEAACPPLGLCKSVRWKEAVWCWYTSFGWAMRS